MEVKPKARLREREEGPGETSQLSLLLLEITAEQLEGRSRALYALLVSSESTITQAVHFISRQESKFLVLFPFLT